MTTKRTPTSPKKTTAVRILRRIGVIVGIIAACLFLLHAVLMGYERISQYIVYKEAEQLLNDPMGRKDLLGMKHLNTFISPRNNTSLLQIEPSSRQSAKNIFELPPNRSPNDILKSLQKSATDTSWTIIDTNSNCSYTCSFVAKKNNGDNMYLDVIITLKSYLSDFSNNTISVSIRKE